MPLTGELEHLPIVDVIQLIHSTRKSGTLNVYSRKGEGQLVFNNGYIVSATHSSERLKIGTILLENKIIDAKDLERALSIQELSGQDRKPLIATLLDHCGLSKEAAYKALESLIEMTVVEMISWTRGIFTLDVDDINVADDYRYLPKQLQIVSLDTQMVLMDALRIFDEKVHAGEIQISDEPLESHVLENLMPDTEETAAVPERSEDEIVVSADILGLADLDKIERKKPLVFKGLEAFDPADIHRQVIEKNLPGLNPEEKDRLADYLADISTPIWADDGQPGATKSQAVIIYTCDDFLQHAIMTVCKKEGILVFVAAGHNELDSLIERALSRHLEPVLVFGPPVPDDSAAFSREAIVAERSLKLSQYPNISILQLASPLDYTFSLQSLNDGIRAVLPLPCHSERKNSYAADMVTFLDTFQSYVRGCFNEERRVQFAKLRNSLSGLRLLKKAPDISLSVLQFVGEAFERSLTLVVHKDHLVAERSIGIRDDANGGPSEPLKFQVPLRRDSLFKQVIKSGDSFWGETDDGSFADLLYPEIGPPKNAKILLLPLKCNERIITLTYADFGRLDSKQMTIDFLEFFVGQAGLAMENALYRRQLSHAGTPKAAH